MKTCAACGTENPDIARFCLACGSQLAEAAPPQETRKVVTIVFSDLKGSTSLGEALDSEALREVMTRYFDAMRAELERHGGVIEKFIGDAVMAVFGLPRLHEDDALRAVRAAAGMQAALERINVDLQRHYGVQLANRTGVNTGEVVAGDPTSLAMGGDPFQQPAAVGDVFHIGSGPGEDVRITAISFLPNGQHRWDIARTSGQTFPAGTVVWRAVSSTGSSSMKREGRLYSARPNSRRSLAQVM